MSFFLYASADGTSQALQNRDIVELGTGGESPANLLELLQDVSPECHPANRGDGLIRARGVEPSCPLVRNSHDPEGSVRMFPDSRSSGCALRSCFLALDLRQKHGCQAGCPEGAQHGRGWIGSMKEVIGKHRDKGRTGKMISCAEQGV